MAVADALVSKVLDMLAKEIEQEVRLVVGVKKQKNMLAKNLESIQAVIVDAERRQWKEASVQLWVDRLKDVSYDIEDVLDEWSFAIMKLQRESDEFSSKPKRKVWSFILSPCFCFREVGFRRDIAVKITELNERLDVISSEKDKYGFITLEGNNEQVERPITTSIIDISEVKGREVDREKLVKFLLAEDSEKPNLCPIAIVGMGGIGKTTLAKLIYNDERVKTHFDKRIWVCVSDPFDEIKIAKEILEFLGGSPNVVSLSKIMENIQHAIKGKKILVVLDDVWNEDPEKWKQLGDCLKCSFRGSRVVVTTRNEKVGQVMGCFESDIFRVGLLSIEESWELFCMIALSRRSSQEREGLEGIGRVVVKRCKGLPLAVKAIAGVLQFKNSRTEWEYVLDSELCDLEKVQRDIVGPLWLSYYDLPSHLKQCFLYCAVFPKDYKMEKGVLIKHWMAQGYIRGTKTKHMEMLAEEYFQNLVMRSLFQDVEEEEEAYAFTKIWCKMHDIVHDFARILVKNECFSIEVDNDSEASSLDGSVGNVVRHLSVGFRNGVRFHDSCYNLKKLRSLILHSLESLDLEKIINEFTSLRSLTLRYCIIAKVPSNINRLIHLRELDLSNVYQLEELPDTLWELYNLQILNLDHDTRIRSVKGIERLTNLRHLDNYKTNFFLPKEMVRSSGLRRLKNVRIDVNNEEAFSLKHLKNFNQLSGILAIKWSERGNGDVEDAKQAQLKDKKYITQLQLSLGITHMLGKQQDEELVEALNAPPNLEFIEVEYYIGLTSPKWLDSLTFLRRVKLSTWSNLEHLPPLGKLPCLEDLEFFVFSRVKKVGAEFLAMEDMMLSSSSAVVRPFPKLRSLKFRALIGWEEWNDVDGDREMLIMPSLTYLQVHMCPMLRALPNFIHKKTSLKVYRY